MINRPLEYFKVAYSILSTVVIMSASNDDFAKLLTLFSFGMVCSYWGNYSSLSTFSNLELEVRKKFKKNAKHGLWLSAILTLFSLIFWLRNWSLTTVGLGPIPFIDIPICYYIFLSSQKAIFMDIEEPVSVSSH